MNEPRRAFFQSPILSMSKRYLIASNQRKRFIETARELECDEDKGRFEEKLGRIAKTKPTPKPKPERQDTKG